MKAARSLAVSVHDRKPNSSKANQTRQDERSGQGLGALPTPLANLRELGCWSRGLVELVPEIVAAEGCPSAYDRADGKPVRAARYRADAHGGSDNGA